MAADETAAMTDSYCIVTGGNSGIGKEIVHGLTAKGAHVVMACRNMEACELVRAELAASGGPGSVACAQLDLEDFASVRACAAGQRAALQGAGRKLSVLVNNAGVMNVPDREGGEDRHMRANHYGPYLLTRLLVPSMGAGSRVVSVSSRAHTYGTIHFDVETGAVDQHPTGWFGKYARSKLANVAFTSELQRRLAPDGVAAHSTSPGPVNTSLFRGFPWYTQWLLQPLARVLLRTPAQGAASSVFAASAPALSGSAPGSWLFIHDNKDAGVLALATDPEVCAKLWDASERFVEWGSHDGDQ